MVQTVRPSFVRLLVILTAVALPIVAHAALTVTPVTWNIVGLDSNSPATGPNHFPVGARVCSDVATTNVSVNFAWDSPNTYVNLRPGSPSTIVLPSIGAGMCADAYFEVEVTKDPAAFDTTRRYHVTATDFSGTASTVVPRELFVEHLISQNRNSISDVKFGPSPLSLTSVAPGGSMNLVVGNTYTVQLIGGTATQGYNQFEAFINFPNTIFQVLNVSTTYSANNSPYVASPNDKLYADACGWQNDPNAPTYRSCVGGDFKSGGSNVVTTYTIKVISGGGTSETLNSLLYDFSGSSFHYNADYSVGARIANLIDPTSATISKSFNPNPASLNGVTALSITITNPNAGSVSGYNFVDNLPANLVIATPPAATTSGCGTPTLTANAGGSSISFANGTVAANGTCVVKVNVTPTATGSLVNTTNHLFVDTNDTGKFATATLTVNNAPPPGTGFCGLTLARWNFETGFNVNAPAPTTANVTATAAPGGGLVPQSSANDNTITPAGTVSWSSNGSITPPPPTFDPVNNEYFEFALNTTGYSAVYLTFDAQFRSANGPKGIAVYYGTSNARPESGTQVFSNNNALTTQNQWVSFGAGNSLAFTSGLNPSGTTYFRIYAFNSGNANSGSDINIDNVLFTGCSPAGVTQPTIAKSFTPNPIAVNGVSTLTFTLTNPNTSPLTGAKFTDTLPSGTQVAATPAASTTCGGSPTWAPAGGATSLAFGQTTGGIIPASGSCTVSVNITAVTAGPHTNVSGNLSTTESGTNTTNVATDTLTAILPPSIAKAFAPSPILANGISRLTFTISNPNPSNAISGVAFSDTLPTSPGAMKVAAVPNLSTTGCGAPAMSAVANSGVVGMSAGTIAAGGTCTVAVDVTAPVAGTYNNTSGNVSHIVNAAVINGNTASAALQVNPPNPSIALLKQVGLSATGPWLSYVSVTTQPVYYRFSIENTGDVPLSPVSITDDTLNVASCNAGWPATLPVAVAANDNHIATCVVGPVTTTSGTHTNTAHATGTFNAVPHNSEDSTATYATAALAIVKSATQTSFTNAGDTINYNYLVTNSGFAQLAGPVTVTDDKTTVTCPSVTTVGDFDNWLDPGESMTCTASYLVTAGDVSAGFVTNTAHATADGVDSPNDSETVLATSAADVAIDKTLTTGGPYTPGQSITYTLLVTNNGPAAATNIQVTDTPTNLTITNVTGACAALPCTIPVLANGGSASITVTATINAAGAFDNSATAIAAEPDPVPSNNTDNTGNNGTTGTSVDIALDKSLVTTPPFNAGQSITYTLQITNNGPSTATNIQVTDTPTNLTITNASGACAALPCTIASLANGANTSITVTATINATGAFDNSATATPAEADSNTANNTDSTGNNGTAGSLVDISLNKSLVTTPPFNAGQSITYTLQITNNGPSTATNIQVTDTPTNLTITNVSGACAALPCTIASLANGANTSITVTATINAAGAFDNAATATPAETDSNTGNNTDNTGNNGTAGSLVDVVMVKTLTSTPPFNASQSITYTLQITNNGPSTATNIQVTDTPTNLTITNVSGACAALPCTIASLANGANTSITVTATINAAGAFDNAATATPAETDSNTANNTDNTGNNGTAGSLVDVVMVKTLTSTPPFNAGQSITYTLQITNNGPSTATNIQITDTPTNLTITNVSGACAALPCTIASLANGANTSITVTATINATGAFDNAATATPAETDSNTANNTDNTGNNGTAGSLVDVSLNKSLVTTPPFNAGQSITYTLQITNNGPSTATNIQVTDTPTNLTITNVSGACAALPCTIASLANGANTSITVTATIDANGAFDNSATATPAETDSNTANNTDNTGNNGTAGSLVDVVMVKTLTSTPPFNAGQSITYTLQITNNGPSTATNIQVTDTPSNLTITNVSGACAALPCTIASLANGANTSITVTATIDANGAFDNSATATPAETDSNTGNNTDNTGNNGTAGSSVDVVMAKSLTSVGPFHAGDSVVYTLQVSNNGPSTATNIQVTDTPTNLTITNVSGACAALPCTIASLASGANTSITVTATILAAGAFDNSATATAAESDVNTSNNTDSTGNNGTAAASADVAMVKTLTSVGPFHAGDAVTYTLQVTNNGPSPATNIQVTDTPTNLTITNVTGACAALPCTIASLANGANANITVTATILAAGAFDNSATANGTESDPDPTNNTDNKGNNGNATAAADVVLVKTLTTVGPFTMGQSITYRLVITNNGPSTATNIQVTDTPVNLTITSVTGNCGALPCTIASLANGAGAAITVTATINADGAFDNSATATPAEFDPNTTNNTDSSGNNGVTGPSADLSVVKTLVTAPPFTPGQTIAYTIVIHNAGPSTATTVQVTDTPTNLTIANVTGACAALPCTIAAIASGSDATINVTATINAAGAFDNGASAIGVETDPNMTNNNDSSGNGGVTTSPTSADVEVTKTASPSRVSVGQTLDYTITVTNHGPATATGVVVTDPLPASFSLLSATSTQGTCSGTTNVTCTVGTMLNGATVTITLHGTVTGSGSLSNTATAALNESDPVPTNNSSTATAGSPRDIPTASEYGLMLLGLMLGIAGVCVMRARF